MYTCIYIYIYTHICIYTYIYTYIHTYIHIYIRVCIWIFTLTHVHIQWTTSQITTAVAGIILSEKMGYNVSLHAGVSSGGVYKALFDGEVDLAFEVWPSGNPVPFKKYAREFVAVVVGEAEEESAVRAYKYTNLFGRSGIFEIAQSTNAPMLQDSLSSPSGQHHFMQENVENPEYGEWSNSSLCSSGNCTVQILHITRKFFALVFWTFDPQKVFFNCSNGHSYVYVCASACTHFRGCLRVRAYVRVYVCIPIYLHIYYTHLVFIFRDRKRERNRNKKRQCVGEKVIGWETRETYCTCARHKNSRRITNTRTHKHAFWKSLFLFFPLTHTKTHILQGLSQKKGH